MRKYFVCFQFTREDLITPLMGNMIISRIGSFEEIEDINELEHYIMDKLNEQSEHKVISAIIVNFIEL
jgi:hypothetical protein